MDTTFAQRFNLGIKTRGRSDPFSEFVPVNKAVKPNQVYKDNYSMIDHDISAFINDSHSAVFVGAKSNAKPKLDPMISLSEKSVGKERIFRTLISNQSASPNRLNIHNKFNEVKSLTPTMRSNSHNKRKLYTPITFDRSFSNPRENNTQNVATEAGKKRSKKYRPYTLDDYKRVRPSKYYVLGGLGAFNIGTEIWKKGVERQERMKKYWKQLQTMMDDDTHQ
ncbi:unnamed protein product [Blepharisma stoltei]|uniref:Uncharacterized protein n=1 Tax=Blepharisma stoltei TaxID=1481888 RepID=A0AAU9JEY7_9CILI|nr:unnamed protein product [Blepharisma stoltei]